jgi:hypothetical protein
LLNKLKHGMLTHEDSSDYRSVVNGKITPYRPGVAQMVGRGKALLFHDHGTRRG